MTFTDDGLGQDGREDEDLLAPLDEDHVQQGEDRAQDLGRVRDVDEGLAAEVVRPGAAVEGQEDGHGVGDRGADDVVPGDGRLDLLLVDGGVGVLLDVRAELLVETEPVLHAGLVEDELVVGDGGDEEGEVGDEDHGLQGDLGAGLLDLGPGEFDHFERGEVGACASQQYWTDVDSTAFSSDTCYSETLWGGLRQCPRFAYVYEGSG